MNEPLAGMADLAAGDPFFLAFALAEYAQAERLDAAGLAAALGTTPDVLPHVGLCRSPGADPDAFRSDVDRIAGKFGLTRDALVAVARCGQAVAAMRPADETVADAGLFLAARDRKP
jgi:hypothetical protein